MIEQASSVAVLYSLWPIYLPSHNPEVLNFPPNATDFHNPVPLRIFLLLSGATPSLIYLVNMCQPQ